MLVSSSELPEGWSAEGQQRAVARELLERRLKWLLEEHLRILH